MGKRPSFQFYPGDWIRDGVSGCSLAAQGLWLRMMIVMHDSERYGYLSTNGSPMPPAAIAQRCGCTVEEYKILLAELISAGVPRRNRVEIIFSKRMAEDEKRRKNARLRQRKQRENAKCHAPVTSMSLPSSSSSSSSKVINTTTKDGECKHSLVTMGCPFEGLVTLYHKHLHGAPKVQKIGKHLRSRLSARWKEYADIKWWVDYFAFVAKSDFLTGRTKQEFRADLYWITGPENMEKILNGRYHQGTGGKVSHTTRQNIENLMEWKRRQEDDK